MSIYRHVGIAVAFSPRMQALLAEAAHVLSHFNQKVSLVHAGRRTPEKEARIRKAAQEAGLSKDVEIYWMSGSAEDALLQAIKEHNLDLMIAGVLRRESAFRYFLGSVARDLVRHAPCSLLLFTEPQEQPRPMRRIVVVTDYSESSLIALTKTLRFAEKEDAERVFVVRVHSTYGEAMVLAEGVRRERAQEYRVHNREKELLQDFVDAAGHTSVEVEPVYIEGHTGLATATFARDHEADLLVMPSVSHYSHFFERLFPTDMEWVLREIPCNLWVARERLTTA